MVLSYLTSRAFACAAHQPSQVFSAAQLQPSRDPLHREGAGPAESHVLEAAPPHAGLSHGQQIIRSHRCVNPRAGTALKPRLATESTEGTAWKAEPPSRINADRKGR